MARGIIVLGASGSGTTLGKELALYVDMEDWKESNDFQTPLE